MATEVHHAAEYAALRATIRERGTARMVLLPIIFIAWAGTAVATSAVITVAISTLIPLMVLAAGFESTLALYLNVERIGRYLQVFHEKDDGWEHVAMAFGQRFAAGGGPDPLFARLFVTAASINFLPVALGGVPVEVGVLAVAHLIVIARIRLGQKAAGAVRSLDLDRFRELASVSPDPPVSK